MGAFDRTSTDKRRGGRRRTRAAAAGAAALAAVGVAGSVALPSPAQAVAGAAPAAPAASSAGSTSLAAAGNSLPRLLLRTGDLRRVNNGGWAVYAQNLTPRTTLEPLASCSGKGTLSPSVSRTWAKPDGEFGWQPESPVVHQRVVRYRPRRGDDVLDLFRATVKRCPTRTHDGGGSYERWRVIADNGTSRTDRLIIRKEPLPPASPFPYYMVVVRSGDTVSLVDYWQGETSRGDDRGAKAIASLVARRLS